MKNLSFTLFLQGLLFKMLDRFLRKKLSQNILREKVSIVSNDCWGGVAYQFAGIEYNTPFVGLFLMAPCYLKLLQRFKFHFERNELRFIKESKYDSVNQFREQKQLRYPIALLNSEVEVHFMHFETEKEAKETWLRRSERINFDNLAIKFDGGKDGVSEELIDAFMSLPFTKKLLIKPSNINAVAQQQLSLISWVEDGAKVFPISCQNFNVFLWLRTGLVKQTVINKLVWRWVFAKK